jgi:hypothetical protein
MDLREIEWEDVDWIHQDGDQWWYLVNMVMNFQVSKEAGISQKGLCSVELVS